MVAPDAELRRRGCLRALPEFASFALQPSAYLLERAEVTPSRLPPLGSTWLMDFVQMARSKGRELDTDQVGGQMSPRNKGDLSDTSGET